MTKPFLSRVLSGYRRIGSRVGLLALLVVLSAALGAAIAFPLWFAATAAPRAYTVAVLAAAAATVMAAAIRRIVRTGIGWNRVGAKALAVLLGLAKTMLLLAGLAAAVAFAVRGRAAPAAVAALVFLAAAAWIGWGARAGSTPKPPATGRY